MPVKRRLLINYKVFLPPALLLLIAVIFGFVNPQAFSASATAALEFTLQYFGWFYSVGATFLLGFCLWACFSKYGTIRFGGPNAKPEISVFNWWAISLCAGIAIGIVFFGVAEPMAHYNSPPPFLDLIPKSSAAAEHSLRYAFFHWTFHAYGIYVSVALCIAFAYYNCNRPFKVSSALYPVIGNRIYGNWGAFIDGLAIFAIVGGVGTSMGFGILQIGSGMEYLWDIEPTGVLWLGIILSLTAAFTVSSYTGLQNGIRYLSEKNVYLFFLLMGFIFVFGPTIFILENTVASIGDYLANVVSMSLYTEPLGDSAWLGTWSVFYWAWWLAFAPVVGLFLVRLAYGRTVRQFVLVTLFGPALFGILWFGVFGSASIYLDHFEGAGISEAIAAYGNEVSMYALFQQFPFSGITIILVAVAIAVSFITLADSMTSTIAGLTTAGFGESGNKLEAPPSMKVFWGFMVGVLSWVLLISGGVAALQASAIVCGAPILVLLLLMSAGFIKSMLDQEECNREPGS